MRRAGTFGSRSDVVFLAMNSDEDRSVVEPFLTAQKWDKARVFRRRIGAAAGRLNIPTTIMIDKSGHVASRMNGFDPSDVPSIK